MSCSRAKSTMRCIHARSTHAVVGLWGNDSTITRGLGHADSHDSMRLSKKASDAGGPSVSVACSRRTWRTSAPAKSGA